MEMEVRTFKLISLVLTPEELKYAMMRAEEIEDTDQVKEVTDLIINKGQTMELNGNTHY